jgi:hypothetical protein
MQRRREKWDNERAGERGWSRDFEGGELRRSEVRRSRMIGEGNAMEMGAKPCRTRGPRSVILKSEESPPSCVTMGVETAGGIASESALSLNGIWSQSREHSVSLSASILGNCSSGPSKIFQHTFAMAGEGETIWENGLI